MRGWLGAHPWAAALLFAAALVAALDALLAPALDRGLTVSQVIADQRGELLRTYLTPDGMIRQRTGVGDVDPVYLRLLLAYEDQRFRHHPGVDPLAMTRAISQAARAGRIISGGSTLTMQTARLLEPRRRTVLSKAIEILRALQLERRFTKDEILGLYLTLAPMGGNLEGVSAASQAYFGKSPGKLTPSEAAVLVALPQAPSRLRRRNADAALKAARDKVLSLAGPRAGLTPAAIERAMAEPVRLKLRPLAFLAPHLSDRLRRADASASRVTSLDGALQRQLEGKARRWTTTLDAQASLAVLVVERRTGLVRAYLGSAGFTSAARAGQVDAVMAVRSPGSTLKPLIYAMAFDDGLAHPLSLVDDIETRFGSYQPTNFEDQYHGQVTAADALRLSLNVPAVLLLDRIGPVRFTSRLARADVPIHLPAGVTPGLPVALGGAGTTLEDLVRLYRALATDGIVRPLRFDGSASSRISAESLAGEQARAWIDAILRSAPRPDGTPGLAAGEAGPVAVKTGTSYGFRDAWAIGWDGRHVVGVWTGRPDGSPSPGRFGVNTAAPILFDIFALMGVNAPPPAVDLAPGASLPPGLARLSLAAGAEESRLRLLFPLDGSTLPLLAGKALPLEASGGMRPYAWLVNGHLLGESATGRALMWSPDGLGFHDVTLIDAQGASRSARIRLVAGLTVVR